MRTHKIKVLVFSFIVIISITTIGWVFYHEELKYAQPTPVPSNFKDVKTGSSVELSQLLPANEHPQIFLHFYNPKCQCSKFNAKDFAALVHEYHQQVSFYVVMQSNDQEEIQMFEKKYKLNVPVILDADQHISKRCGVYSTPQAVILNSESRIYYKGNYNKARFCDSKKTAFAKTALAYLLEGKSLPKFSEVASIPYGCQIPDKSE